jgi:hypothetical protein
VLGLFSVIIFLFLKGYLRFWLWWLLALLYLGGVGRNLGIGVSGEKASIMSWRDLSNKTIIPIWGLQRVPEGLCCSNMDGQHGPRVWLELQIPRFHCRVRNSRLTKSPWSFEKHCIKRHLEIQAHTSILGRSDGHLQ